MKFTLITFLFTVMIVSSALAQRTPYEMNDPQNEMQESYQDESQQDDLSHESLPSRRRFAPVSPEGPEDIKAQYCAYLLSKTPSHRTNQDLKNIQEAGCTQESRKH